MSTLHKQKHRDLQTNMFQECVYKGEGMCLFITKYDISAGRKPSQDLGSTDWAQ